jgi:hypothetical protein
MRRRWPLDLFRTNVKKDPNSWIGHNEAARIAVSKGDFERAIKEMNLALDGAPDSLKAQHADRVRRLQHHEGINK